MKSCLENSGHYPIIKNQLEEIESILFGSKAKEIAIERFIKEFGEKAIKEVMKNDKSKLS